MGNGASKPEQQVFSAYAATQTKHREGYAKLIQQQRCAPQPGGIVPRLQLHIRPNLLTSYLYQTDATRAHDVELKVQARVREELTRIRDHQSTQLAHLTDSLTVSPPHPTPSLSDSDPNPSPPTTGLASHLRSPFYQNHSPRNPTAPSASSTPSSDSGRSSASVKKEIMDLREKLESRKQVESVPKAVEQAKEKVVQCLRTNDRRPLDCWKEVEEFKREVGRLEARFVERVGR
ncbi:hypothetical protein LTR29_016509 [Friedmanniomyces endolithicus]|nr:hypothetical protein LTR29_016509 [Friedmanniomyces endolithicus]